MKMRERRFPILETSPAPQGAKQDVPWGLVEPHREQAQLNHYQSLERLAERGGLSWCELIAVLEDRPWRRMDNDIAEQQVRTLLRDLGEADDS